MLGGPILVDEMGVPHGFEVVDYRNSHGFIPGLQNLGVLPHQKHEVRPHQGLRLIDILRQEIENQLPATFLAKLYNTVEILHPRVVVVDIKGVILHKMRGQLGHGLVAVAFGVLHAFHRKVVTPVSRRLKRERIGELQGDGLFLLVGQLVPLARAMDGIGFERQQRPAHQRRITLHQHQLFLQGRLQRRINPIGPKRPQVHRHHHSFNLVFLGNVL